MPSFNHARLDFLLTNFWQTFPRMYSSVPLESFRRNDHIRWARFLIATTNFCSATCYKSERINPWKPRKVLFHLYLLKNLYINCEVAAISDTDKAQERLLSHHRYAYSDRTLRFVAKRSGSTTPFDALFLAVAEFSRNSLQDNNLIYAFVTVSLERSTLISRPFP